MFPPPPASDLVPCPRCGRKNAARRTACLYCGERLPVTEESATLQVPTLRPVEEWEKGFSVVLAPLDDDAPAEVRIARLCEVARMEEDFARAIFESRSRVPVARVPTRAEADLVVRLLDASGIASEVVADEDLVLGTHLRRIRALRFDDDALHVDVLWGGRASLVRSDVVCVVKGRVVSSAVEMLEAAGKQRDGHRDLVETSEFFAERYAVDVYGPTLDTSYRIKAEAFDFACLGERPAPDVATNVTRLCAALAGFVGHSRYDGAYSRLARLLDHAWPPVSRVSSRGLARRGATIKKFTSSVVEKDSLGQFTRYSRLRYVTWPR